MLLTEIALNSLFFVLRLRCSLCGGIGESEE